MANFSDLGLTTGVKWVCNALISSQGTATIYWISGFDYIKVFDFWVTSGRKNIRNGIKFTINWGQEDKEESLKQKNNCSTSLVLLKSHYLWQVGCKVPSDCGQSLRFWARNNTGCGAGPVWLVIRGLGSITQGARSNSGVCARRWQGE